MLRPGDGLGRDALFDVGKKGAFLMASTKPTNRRPKERIKFEERLLYFAPAKRALLRILPLNL